MFKILRFDVLLEAVRTSQELNECRVFKTIGSVLQVPERFTFMVNIVSSFSKRKTAIGYHRLSHTAEITSNSHLNEKQ